MEDPSKDLEVIEPAFKRTGNPFKKGHPRYGGRPKGSPNKKTLMAREIAEHMKVDPVRYMLEVLNSDALRVVKTDPDTGKVIYGADGKMEYEMVPVTQAMKMDAAKNVAPYVHARLSASQVTGKDEGPVQVAQLPTAEILRNPQMASALTDLAMLVAQAEAADSGVN